MELGKNAPDSLCKTCRQIDFQSLIYPDGSDSRKPHVPLKEGPYTTAWRGTTLGTLASVAKRASTCGFCALVVDAATRVHARLDDEDDSDQDSQEDDEDTDDEGSDKEDSDSEDSGDEDSNDEDSEEEDSKEGDSDNEDSDDEDSDDEDSDNEDSDNEDSDNEDSDNEDSDNEDSEEEDGDEEDGKDGDSEEEDTEEEDSGEEDSEEEEGSEEAEGSEEEGSDGEGSEEESSEEESNEEQSSEEESSDGDSDDDSDEDDEDDDDDGSDSDDTDEGGQQKGGLCDFPFIGPVHTPSSDGTDGGSDKNSDNGTDDGTEISTLPTLDNGKPIKCKLRWKSFCVLEHVPYDGRVIDFHVNRLVVSFSPLRSWKRSKSPTDISFQACWDSQDGDLVKGSGRKFSSLVDFELVREWIKCCEVCHGAACRDPKWLWEWEQPDLLRVIDVDKECIISAPPDCRYLALSYVRGQLPPEKENRFVTRTTTANIGQLSKEHALSSITLPKTIRDSMTLTAALGERYLWVDAFCIVQDDSQEVVAQTANMDLIYAGALITIVAAGGDNADAGLPGVTKGSREVTQGRVQVAENLSILQTAEQGHSRNLKSSKWNSRGWTFQESLLSRRSLIFTQDMLYWTCDSSMWDEETILEPEQPKIQMKVSSIVNNDASREEGGKFTLEALSGYIKQYTSRDFTYESDILPAFLGITQRMEVMTGERFHWGLPCTRFDQSLMWEYGDHRRLEQHRVVLDGGIVHQVPYPSWSWMGWTGDISPVVFNRGLHEYTLAGNSQSELEFYMLMSDGSVRAMAQLTAASTFSNTATEDQRIKCIRKDSLTRLWKGATKVGRCTTVSSMDSSGISSSTANLAISGVGAGGEAAVSRRVADLPVHDTGRLVFWTSCARIQTWNMSSIGSVCEIYIPAKKRRVKIDGNLPTSMGPFSVLFPRDSRRGPETNKLTKPPQLADGSCFYDYIVVSRYYRGKDDKTGQKDLNFLLVQWTDAKRNVAIRIGNARMSERDWMCLDREWKLVILE